MKVLNNNIDINSFFHKQPKKVNESFGVYFITGYQGSGKTYLGVYFLYKYFKDLHIYTNIHSLDIKDANITYFDYLEEITDNIEENCIFLIDEISKKYTKNAPQDKKLYSWLQQSRKRKRYVLLITQEYLQIPMWLRGIASVVYTTHKVKFLPIFSTVKGYPVLTEDKEWSVDVIGKYIYKRNKYITDLYDTFEPVPVL